MSHPRFYVGVFGLTASTLMLQLIQTRILSVVAWYHLAFFVISIAMFGLTAGSVWVYLQRDRFSEKTLSADLAYFTGAFAASSAGLLAVQMTLAPVIVRTLTSVLVWLELAVCLAVPFFFAGVATSLALTRSPLPVGRVYGVDLLGASLGCFGVLALLNSTDGPAAALWVSVLAALAAASFRGSGIGGEPAGWRPLASLLARPGRLLFVLTLCAAANDLSAGGGLRPLAVKGAFESTGTALFEEWNSFSRVAVFPTRRKPPQMWGASPRTPARFVVDERRMNIDGDVGTTMYHFEGERADAGFLRYDVTNLAYFVPGRRTGAVIGVGGGRDVLSAWSFGLQSVIGVEINPIFVKLLEREPGFADFANVRDLDGVELVVDEARSWFARSDEHFDVVQMSLTDTWAATGAGAFSLSENSLYTLEAWRIFVDRLTPRGVFTVSRWYDPENVDETGRMLGLAVAALLDRGVAEPRRHLYLASSGRLATLVVAREPFPPAALDALDQACERLAYGVLVSPRTPSGSPVLESIASARSREDLDAAAAQRTLDLTPPTDDRPFFFNQLPFSEWTTMVNLTRYVVGQSAHRGGVRRGNLVASATLLALFAVALGLVAATIVFPLRPALADAGRRLVTGGTAYFLLIGTGFMSIEIGLLQRMSVFLGHPIYSLSVVLFTLILTAGLGSLASDRWPLATRGRFATWALSVALYVASLPLWLPGLLLENDGASLAVRIALCVATIAPAGALLGFGFPTGMRLVSGVDTGPTPWFWGINGAAGTLSAITAVVTSIAFGISTTLWIGASCYVLLIPAAFHIGFRGATAGRFSGLELTEPRDRGAGG